MKKLRGILLLAQGIAKRGFCLAGGPSLILLSMDGGSVMGARAEARSVRILHGRA